MRLPDFLIIGTMRGGTSSMFHYLCSHEHIKGSVKKEPHFFDVFYDRGISWYCSQFPPTTKGAMLCEATPHYLNRPVVPSRTKKWLPDARFIALLRDPVDRAWSHFCHARERYGLSDEDLLDPSSSVLQAGRYAEHLDRWFGSYPRERFLVVKSEDFFADPQLWTNRALCWLGLQNMRLQEYKRLDPLKRPNIKYPPILPQLRIKLATYYMPHNERLSALLGRDFGWST